MLVALDVLVNFGVASGKREDTGDGVELGIIVTVGDSVGAGLLDSPDTAFIEGVISDATRVGIEVCRMAPTACSGRHENNANGTRIKIRSLNTRQRYFCINSSNTIFGVFSVAWLLWSTIKKNPYSLFADFPSFIIVHNCFPKPFCAII